MKKLFLVFLLLQIGLFAQLNNTNFNIMRGDATTLTFASKYNLTGDSLIFVVKASKDITAVRLIQKTSYDNQITISTGTKSFLYIKLLSDDTDDLTLAKYYYDITRIKNGDTTTIFIGELNLQPDIGTPFDGTDVTGRVTTVSLDNGTADRELIWWNDSLEYWEPSGVTFTAGGSVGNADSLGGIPASSYLTSLPDSTVFSSELTPYATNTAVGDSFNTRMGAVLDIDDLAVVKDYEPVIADSSILLYSSGVWQVWDLGIALQSLVAGTPTLPDSIIFTSELTPYLLKSDTTSLSNRINLKLTATDTASLSNRINLKFNTADTSVFISDALADAKYPTKTALGDSVNLRIPKDVTTLSAETPVGTDIFPFYSIENGGIYKGTISDIAIDSTVVNNLIGAYLDTTTIPLPDSVVYTSEIAGDTLIGTSATLDSIITDYWNDALGGGLDSANVSSLISDSLASFNSADSTVFATKYYVDTEITSIVNSGDTRVPFMWAYLQLDTTGSVTAITDSTDATVSTLVESYPFGVSANDVARVSVDSGAYKVLYDLGGSPTWTGWLTSEAYYKGVDSAQVRHYASSIANTETKQIFTVSGDVDTFSVTTVAGGSYDADAEAYFAVATGLSTNRKDTINQFIVMLKDSLSLTNLSDRMAGMWILSNTDTVASLTNIVHPDSLKALTNGGVAFSVDRGWIGNGTTGYINTRLIPSWQSVLNYNDLSFGVYIRTNVSEDMTDLGFSKNGSPFTLYRIRTRSVTHGFVSSISNEVQIRIFENASLTSAGFSMVTRRGALDAESFRDGVSYVIDTDNTSAGYDFADGQVMSLLGWIDMGDYTGYDLSTKQIAFAFIMDGMTTVEARGLNNCIEWFMDAIGAGVEP